MSKQLYLADNAWHKTLSGVSYSGWMAIDNAGNEYRQPANLETVTVRMAKTGAEYTDWTLAGAMDWAQRQVSA